MTIVWNMYALLFVAKAEICTRKMSHLFCILPVSRWRLSRYVMAVLTADVFTKCIFDSYLQTARLLNECDVFARRFSYYAKFSYCRLICPSLLWHCLLGFVSCKSRCRNDLLCVGLNVKLYSRTHSISVSDMCDHIDYPCLSQLSLIFFLVIWCFYIIVFYYYFCLITILHICLSLYWPLSTSTPWLYLSSWFSCFFLVFMLFLY